MATTPVPTPQPPSELSMFVHKVLYAHIGIFILMLSLMGAGGYIALRSYDKVLAHAEALQTQFNVAQGQAAASQKQLTDLLAADAVQRAKESAQQAALEQQIINRNTQAQVPAVQQALQPSAGAKAVILGLQSLYTGSIPPVMPKLAQDGNIEISAPEGQQWLSDKVSLNRFSADYRDEVQLYTLEVAKSTSLSNDLSQCKGTVSQDETALVVANKTIAAYKKSAVRSRWKKFLGGAKDVALVMTGVVLGHKI